MGDCFVCLFYFEQSIEFDLCYTKEVDQFQDTSGVKKKEGDKPKWFFVACAVPKGKTFPKDRPNHQKQKRQSKWT